MDRPLGVLEVIGYVTATACVDTMVKTAFVDIYNIEKTGNGYITIMIQGDLASVQAALEAGQEEALKHGELINARAIPRPYEGLERLISPERGGES